LAEEPSSLKSWEMGFGDSMLDIIYLKRRLKINIIEMTNFQYRDDGNNLVGKLFIYK
jgi:hypothetical protein